METIRSRTPNAWSTNILQNNQRSTNPLQNNQSTKDAKHALYYETSDDNSSEEEGSKLIDQNLGEGIFKEYLSIHGKSSDEAGLSKIKNLLAASKCGAVSCLICLEKVRSIDPIWNCQQGCHAIFHLICIQEWARQASNSAAERSIAQLSRDQFPSAASTALENSCWHCPKCRLDYPQFQIPRKYTCFCGKLEDPPNDPWITPHTCGEICRRPLQKNCGHECVLLCHPGPCPPCPQLVKAKCFCGALSDVRRCGLKFFSCNGPCSRPLTCGLHRCEDKCHDGPCRPCQKKGVYRCKCGKLEKECSCSESEFRCERPCDQELSCGKHLCLKGCHSGPCGECELQGRRTCPCGKVEYNGIPCDAVVPTCGSTCEKMLRCSLHRCPDRCHSGPCVDTCRIVTVKFCRCGSSRKEVPCYEDLICQRKCQRVRDCGRHPCKRRCCGGDCALCTEVCGKKLRCNNHKCPSPCHRGICAPCPVTVRISCACGETSYEVPCGAEKGLKPPRCSRKCSILPQCRHGSKCKPHRCHYGACPPCELVCDEDLPCGHKCKERCHGPRPPPNREFTLKPKKRKNVQESNESLGVPCPPCLELVVRQCVGGHIGGERKMVCSQSTAFGCGNYCDNLLPCGNHHCKKPCHKIRLAQIGHSNVFQFNGRDTGQTDEDNEASSSARYKDLLDSCDECELPCQKKRFPACPHPCPQLCHPGDCQPCKILIKRACYCGTMTRVFECSEFNILSEEQQQKVRPCGGPCHRKLPNCTHLCPEICHPGPCPSAQICRKKVMVRCSCQRLKREWICMDVQAAYLKSHHSIKGGVKSGFGLGILPCDKDCERLLEEKMAHSELQQRKQVLNEDKAEQVDPVPKRRKRRGQVQEKHQRSKLQGTS
ncbi:NF-X1-type zinc finger protein NFXL2 isoform X2 [Cryptomeria japonica]|uniref:NF-X1-type zinc finger protein NFXL2 isoform X2 n=1 Tax=Cryptomeria japonica TaxID=3369 RepID=UPI0027D9E176|nr:NF-X1-type zinc finger protein NFXL2 isoform X2 [Cryptomeria japonica]